MGLSNSSRPRVDCLTAEMFIKLCYWPVTDICVVLEIFEDARRLMSILRDSTLIHIVRHYH